MPTITIPKSKFLKSLEIKNEDFDIEEFLFNFGLEVEECDDKNYRIEVPANRFDLLSFEGLSNALRVYSEIEKFKPLEYSVEKNKIFIEKNSQRSKILCAIIKNINLEDCYDSFIEYQEILHETLARNRKYISIGTHDADKIKFPVFYKNVENLEFIPLNSDKKVKDLKKYYENDKKFLRYFKYIDGYSVFVDNEQNILSVPPIINSEYSKVTKETRNIFIEITGTDLVKAKQAMNYILHAFRGSSVILFDDDFLKPQIFTFSQSEINKSLDLNLSLEQIKKLLERAMHLVEIKNEENIKVFVYGLRSDVLHKCDLIEDIAINYGYNNFEMEDNNIVSIGIEDPINKFSNKIRNEVAMCGFLETLNFSLHSGNELSNFCELENLVSLENPKSKECEYVRNKLIPSLFKTLLSNKHCKIPIKIFEVGDIVKMENGKAINERHIAALYSGKNSGYEEIQGLISFILSKCNLEPKYIECVKKGFIEKRCGVVECENKNLGWFGIIDTNLCKKMGLNYVCTALELNLELIFELFINKNK